MFTILLRNMPNVKAIAWLVAFVTIPVASALAQPDDTEQQDTQSYDYYDENIDGGGDNSIIPGNGTDGSDDEPKKPEKKPYVRIVMPVDSITELITYDSIIEQTDSYYDSLYLRAKRWVTAKWYADKKQKELVKVFTDDVLYEKFKVKVKLPMRVRYNKFSSNEYGQVEFNLTMRFKDGKYKYHVSNMIHLLPETSDKKDINYVYLEFYMKSEKNVVNYDRYLRAADAAVRKMVVDMTKAMREPVEVDEDDW